MNKKFIGIFICTLMLFATMLPVSGITNTAIKEGKTSQSSGNIIYVGGTGPNNYTTIQAGINVAQPGDTVFVYHKIYYEHVTINKAIHLIGENQTTTIINGSNVGSVISVSSPNTEISRFTIQGSGNSVYEAGIKVQSQYITITNNIFIGRGDWGGPGVYLLGSSYITISNNTLTTCGDWASIYLKYSNNNIISGNIITNGVFFAICLDDSSSNNTIFSNIINNNRNGIYFTYGSNTNVVTANTLIDNHYEGINIEQSSGEIICDNELGAGGGIFIDRIAWSSEADWLHTIQNNTIDGKPMYYYRDATDVTVPSDGAQVILANCTHCTIQGLYFDNTGCSIQLGYTTYTTIQGNTIDLHSYGDGIHLTHVSHTTITQNTITTMYEAPYGEWPIGIESVYSLDNNTLSDNVITGFSYGILLRMYPYPNNITISHNYITDSLGGIAWYQYWNSSTTAITIQGNVITNCYLFGINLFQCTNVLVIENEFVSAGIRIGDQYTVTSGNIIYHNNFVNCTGWACCDNIWYSEVLHQGNYWSAFDQPMEGAYDNNNDGIVDTGFPIPGNNTDEDLYPLMHRFVLGDMNADGQVNFGDINPFILALTKPSSYQFIYHLLSVLHGDINQDGVLDFGDINPFVALLTTGHYP